MIRRPPRSPLFPLHAALPISIAVPDAPDPPVPIADSRAGHGARQMVPKRTRLRIDCAFAAFSNRERRSRSGFVVARRGAGLRLVARTVERPGFLLARHLDFARAGGAALPPGFARLG